MPSFMKGYQILLAKDLVRELKTKESLSSMLVYAVLVLAIYGAALSQSSPDFDRLSIAGGLIWVLILFTSLLGFNRSFAYEMESRSFDALLLAPLERPLIFLSKMSSNLIILLVVECISVPLFFFLFLSGLPLSLNLGHFILSLLVGSLGIAGVGTFLASLTLESKGKEILLALVMVPLIFPLLYSCVSASSLVLMAVSGYEAEFWRVLAMGGLYDVVMLVAAYALYEFVVG